MLSSVLRSERAILVNVEIMRAFVRAGAAPRSHGEILAKIDGLERRFAGKFQVVFEAIRLTLPWGILIYSAIISVNIFV